jgi:DNA polymerase-1
MSGTRFVYDIECNGLYFEATRMWILVAYDLDTKEIHYFLEGDLGWMNLFNNAKLVVGHNIIGYDNLVLKKLFNYEFPSTCNIHDTLLMSYVLNYRRFGQEGHGLKRWGQELGSAKIEFEDFSQYTEEMKTYCIQDVNLNVMVYDFLRDELAVAADANEKIRLYLKVEHAVAKWCAKALAHGWPFDMEKALVLKDILEKELAEAEALLEPRLGYKVKVHQGDKKKGVIDVKEPVWTKKGVYAAHTANYFEVNPFSGYEGEERPIAGSYVRVDIEALKLSSSDDVKLFLFRQGWEPTEYNTVWDPELKRHRETSPKITDDSLEFLDGDGKYYVNYKTALSRYGILKGWLENTDEHGFLHGDCFTIGTPSMRATHSIIVNVPASTSRYGKEMRELFGSMPGWTLIGCDSASNQARGLAHFLGDAEFTDTLINGDIHTYNANIIDSVLTEMGHDWNKHIIDKDLTKPETPDIWSNYGSKEEWLRSGSDSAIKEMAKVKRASAKRILYAFLFGASGKKLWSYIFGVQNSTEGNKLKNGFTKAVPGFKALMDKLEKIYASTKKKGYGYIPSIAGNRIYVDSFHKLLVYLLQSTEKITCGAACLLLMERLEAAGIPYIPAIMMHDELDFFVPDAYAKQAGEIGRKCFQDGPALFGVTIMDGGPAALGKNWYECH